MQAALACAEQGWLCTDGPVALSVAVVFGDRRKRDLQNCFGALCDALDVQSDVSVGSSLKFCLLARGDAELYPRFTPTCEWDTAAGQAVLEAAGGAVVTLDGERLRYGKGELAFLNPYFVAAGGLELARRGAAEMTKILG